MSRKNKKEKILSKEIQKDIMAKRKQITLNRDEIVANPLNDFGIEDIPELKNSIMLQGLLDPLGVMGPLEDNRYMLLSGERRWRAINELVDEGKISFGSDRNSEWRCRSSSRYLPDGNLSKLQLKMGTNGKIS